MAGGRAVVADVESAESASSPEPDGVGVRRDSYRLETPATRGEGRGGGIQTKHEIIIQKNRLRYQVKHGTLSNDWNKRPNKIHNGNTELQIVLKD